MKLGRLIDLLEDLRDELGDEAEVHIAEQPSWPFEYTIQGVASRGDVRDGGEEGEEFTVRDYQTVSDVILVAGRQLGYTDKALWDVARR